MNKAELIDAMAKETGMTKADSKKALEAFVSSTVITSYSIHYTKLYDRDV